MPCGRRLGARDLCRRRPACCHDASDPQLLALAWRVRTARRQSSLIALRLRAFSELKVHDLLINNVCIVLLLVLIRRRPLSWQLMAK